MPELPEVETARRLLERWARGRRVRRVMVSDRRAIAGGPRSLAALVKARFHRFERRGKHLLITLRHGHQPIGLWSHLGMSGKWLRRELGQQPPRFSRAALELDDGVVLHYDDLRLFGKLRVVKGAAFEAQPVIAALGPDPLNDGIDVDRLAARLGRSKQPVKPLLLDQPLVPGIGNIQASESLFRAAIDPRRPAASLTRAEVGRLARGMRPSIDYTLRSFQHDVRGKDIQYVEDPGRPQPVQGLRPRRREVPALQAGHDRAAGAGRPLDVLLRPLPEVASRSVQRARSAGARMRAFAPPPGACPADRQPAADDTGQQHPGDEQAAGQARAAGGAGAGTVDWACAWRWTRRFYRTGASSGRAIPRQARSKAAICGSRGRKNSGVVRASQAKFTTGGQRPALSPAAAAALDQHGQRLQQEERQHQAGAVGAPAHARHHQVFVHQAAGGEGGQHRQQAAAPAGHRGEYLVAGEAVNHPVPAQRPELPRPRARAGCTNTGSTWTPPSFTSAVRVSAMASSRT